MATLHTGVLLRTRPLAGYASRLNFAELDLGPKPPGTKALASWREALGDSFVIALVAPGSLWGERDWPLRDEREVSAELDRLGNMVFALKPRVLVLRPPAAVRPGSAALERLRGIAARLAKMAPIVAWEPPGMWSLDDAEREARALGYVPVVDPLRDDVSDAKIVYARMRGLGADRRYHAGRLEDLWEAIAHGDEAFVVFESDGAEREARKLAAIALGQDIEEDEDDDEDDDEDTDESDGGDD